MSVWTNQTIGAARVAVARRIRQLEERDPEDTTLKHLKDAYDVLRDIDRSLNYRDDDA